MHGGDNVAYTDRLQDPFMHQNFKQILDRLLNVFFLAAEKLYIGTR
jgi:hypothetical protein